MPSRGSPSRSSARLPAYRRDVAVELGVRLLGEGREAGVLGEHRRADREVAGEHVDRAAQLGRARASSRSASRSSRSTWRTSRRRPPSGWSPRRAPAPSGGLAVEGRVLDAVVDLVADQLDPVLLAPRGQRGELARAAASCRSGWPGSRPPDPQPARGRSSRASRAARPSAGSGWRGRSGPRPPRSPGGQDVAVARVAGPGHRHPVAVLERGQEGQQEAAAGAGGDDHLVGVHVDAVHRWWWPAIASRSSRMPVAGV